MNKTRLVLIAVMVLVFAAGVSLGLLIAGNKTSPRPHHLSVLASELNLNPQQRAQMEQIWSDVMGPTFRTHSQKRSELQQERDEGVLSLIPDDQKSKFDLIQQYYSFRMETLGKERQKAFDQAVEQTKKILTPEQVAKYEQVMKQQRERWRQGGYRGMHRYGASRPTSGTQPSAPRSAE